VTQQDLSGPRSFLLLAAIVAVALRVAFALGYWNHQPLTRDEREYLSLARSIAAGRGFEYDADVLAGPVDPFGRAPGYPLFLALVGGGRAVTSSVPASVKIAQSIIGGLGVVMVGLLAGKLAGGRAGIAAAFIAACYPPLIWISAYAFSEALAWPLGLAAAWCFDRANERRSSPVAWATCGVLSGLTVLVRPAILFFLIVSALWLLSRRRILAPLVLSSAAIVAMAPWTIRNYSRDGRFVLVASEGGVTFWTGNHPQASGEGDLAANPELKRASQALRARSPGLTEEQMEPVYYREALGWIRSHPLSWCALEVRKMFFLVVPIGPSYRVHSTRYYTASLLSYGLLLPAGVAGWWRMRGARTRATGLLLLAGSAVLTCLVFFPQERFRIPVIDPTLIVGAGALMASTREVRVA
jgi:4-amino-4-deoxy-L-arabinose transferase-like glycosyltransferase